MTRVIYYSNQRVLPLLHLDPLPSLALITTHNRQNEADGNNKNDKDDWLLLYGKSSAMAWYDFLLVSELSGQSKVITPLPITLMPLLLSQYVLSIYHRSIHTAGGVPISSFLFTNSGLFIMSIEGTSSVFNRSRKTQIRTSGVC